MLTTLVVETKNTPAVLARLVMLFHKLNVSIQSFVMSPAEGGILHFVITVESETDPSLRILPSVYKNIDVLIATQSAQLTADAVNCSKAHSNAPKVAIEKKKTSPTTAQPQDPARE